MSMRARTVDWALLVLVTFEVVTGLISFTVGRPQGRLLFVIHGWVGLSIIVLLFWKLRRVSRRVTELRHWRPATIVSVLLSVTAIGSWVTGIVWTTLQWPVDYPSGMILHTTFGILLLVFVFWHLVIRYRPLSRRDVRDRRSAFSALGVLLASGLVWTTQHQSQQLLQTPGANRRFTGSRSAGPERGNGAFPVTMWMLDRPAPLDLEDYTLSLSGLINRTASYGLERLASMDHRDLKAVIDCTGGWYSHQVWSGVPVSDLLELAQPTLGARYVSFVSATGYRWSLPIQEAYGALLATHVGGELLSHGHGAPLRLVAPGRRGFQWVKWVVAINVISGADLGQWRAIFSSGLR